MAEPALEPTIKPGDIVIISLTRRQFAQGGIFVVNLDGTLLLCRLNKLPGRFRLAFDNPPCCLPSFWPCSTCWGLRRRNKWFYRPTYVRVKMKGVAVCLEITGPRSRPLGRFL